MKIQLLSFIVLFFSVTNALAQTTFQKIFGGTGYDIFEDAIITSDSGYILVGYRDSMSAGINDVYVVRTNGSGDTLWTAAYGGSEIEAGRSIRETSDGGFIITGTTKVSLFATYDIYVMKINSNGDLLWSKSYGSPQNDWGMSIKETSDNGFILTGRTEINQLIPDIFLIKINSSGDTLWTRIYNGPDHDVSNSVLEYMDGGFILTGYTENFGFGSSDILLMKTDSNGNMLWASVYGNTSHDYGWMVQQASDSGFVIAASSADSTGYYDFAFLKTSATGNRIYCC